MFKNLILLSGFSTFVVIAIIALNIYHARTDSTLSPLTKERSTPIDATFDQQTLQELRSRNAVPVDLTSRSGVITQDELDATQGATIARPTVTVTPTPPIITAPAIPATQAAQTP